MTLVVGRITQGGIRIDSDSRITDPKIVSNKNSVFSGLLKTIILNPSISVSYAGDVEIAQKAIEKLYNLEKFEINKIKSLLLKLNIESGNETDFLIASLENQPLLYKISNGKIEPSNSFHWIGDITAFNLFQKEFIPNIKNIEANHICSVHSDAFNKVIESDKIESVGGFHITVHRTKFGLEYLFKMKIISGQSTSMTLRNNEFKSIPFGNAQTGAFSYSYLKSNNPFLPAIGIHFPIGNFGTLYYPKISREIIFYKDVNPFEFAKKVKNEYKIELSGMVKNGDLMTMI
ncbi:hypothetical protein [Tenacibaculum piscium]|uniref:hypothetical protein n=1 Tax=Tenacibaculum piscium TaxID=1458515 RepID=UPI001F418DDC|nr:hypothetical protein [Tenacibaculum piscium]